ncbi:fasciclin domain-containing protein [Pedobacter sp. MW01-1-1]|uniref:fasciclin domain-containing protein n=1 Tax=Pedobacter sp. MW01-1-1 TaxID=3383027 RepID=UPI003FEFE448
MSKIFSKFLIVSLTFISVLTSCRKEEFDKFYGRPETLADPIYQQLQAKGNFTKFLECIDKAGYKETLSTAGSWTVFAPTDEAFKAYMSENSLTEISADLASSIVRYSMTYDGEKIERLSDNLTARGFVKNTAFRRRSVYYDFVYDGTDNNGNAIKVIAGNRNGSYLATDFNNKNLPYFLTAYMNFAGLKADDYQGLYPGSTYTGLNVGPARISEQDIVAENGVVHIIDKVLSPPKSIDQYVSSKTDYSVFKSMLDKYVSYSLNSDISRKYQVLTGKSDNVYAKVYSNLLAFSPNNENYLKVDPNDGQTGMYGIFAPTDAAVQAYSKTLLKYYGRTLKPGTYKEQLNELYAIRPDIIRDFINSHLFLNPVWPTKFRTTTNFLVETTKLATTDIKEVLVLSNGTFYGVNKAQDASVFSTVYGKVNIDPTYKIMKQALDFFGFTNPIKTASLKYLIIPIPDATLVSMGFSYDPFYPTSPIRGDNVMLRRILQTHIIPLLGRDVPNLATGSGILETSNGEYIRYASGKVFSAGTEDNTAVADQSVVVDSTATATNGADWYVSKALTYTTQAVSTDIAKYGTLSTDPYYSFWQYLKGNVTLYNASTGAIQGITDGTFYTIFIPTNSAVLAAVTAGLLPKNTNGTPNYAPTLPEDIAKVTKFIQYHIINKTSIAADGQKTGLYETLYKNDSGDVVKLTVATNTTSSLSLRDITNSTADVLLGASNRSNVLSNRTVIHQINTYLKYQF